jgi:integrase
MEYDDITVHGFRSTFRNWAGDLIEFQRETVEIALAHVLGSKTERAYRRSRALQKRTELMEAWARFCLGKDFDVREITP